MGRWNNESRSGGGDALTDPTNESKTDIRLRESRDNDVIDSKYGFDRITDVREEVEQAKSCPIPVSRFDEL